MLSDDLLNSVAFNLRLAQSASFADFKRMTEESGLKPGDYAVLRIIDQNPGVMPSQVSAANGRDKSTLTPHLTNLEKHGLITREKSEKDRRVQHLYLTPAGKAKVEVLARRAKVHDANLDALMSNAEKQALLKLLRRIWQDKA